MPPDLPVISYVTEGEPALTRFIIGAVERMSGQRKLQALYDSLAHLDLTGVEFWGRALEALEIGIDVRPGAFACLRDAGPTVVVANHPFGVVDGLALCHLTAQERPDSGERVAGLFPRPEQHAVPALELDQPGTAYRLVAQ